MIYLTAASISLSTSTSPTRWYSSSIPGAVVNGTIGADWLSASDPSATLMGGAGDDTYAIWDNRITILELDGGGIDTVQSWAGFTTLNAHVENLQLMQGNQRGIGNALDNILTGGAGNETLDGGAGNDVLVGGAGADAFVIARGNGSDVIVDFQPGTDTIRLQGYALYSFAAVKAAMTQAGVDTTIALGGGETLVLRNTLASSLTARDLWLPTDPLHAGMRQTFGDEFNGFSASASGIGTTWKTTYKINDQLRTLPTNKEAEYYSDSSVGVNPFSISNGILDITAAPGSNPLGLAYNSGAITTAKSFAQLYGYFEARVDLPAGQGFWPAFWLLPADGSWPPEIDIFEVLGNAPTTAYASVGSTLGSGTTFKVNYLPDLSAGFHTYGLSWQADMIRWYIDGTEVAEIATPADMNKPMYMLLNLAVGDTGSWPGKYDPSLPTAHMLIDYVRAWQYGTATPPAPAIPVVTGPANVGAAGGTYTLRPDGLSDLYDFTKARAGIHLDATSMSTKPTHTVWGSTFGDDVQAGAGTLNFDAGSGDDIFRFGTGTSRVAGGAGNDTFAFTKGAIAISDHIIDFHLTQAGGGEHDLIRLDGFSAAAHLDYKSGSGSLQYYVVIDGSYTSAAITIQMANGAARLTAQDYAFTHA